MPIFKSKAKNSPAYARSHDEDKYRGLENTINLAINARITLVTNIWISKGLVNGANGIIRDVIFEPNNPNPTALLIQFDNYNGPRLFDENDAYALTIHKSQGATLKQAVIDLGKCEKTLGLTFVALSRLCNYKDFLIQPFSLERLKKISKF